MEEFQKKTFVFKITLKDSWPLVWRRLHVPATWNFEQFSDYILVSMGWFNSHLHQFKLVNPDGQNVEMISKYEIKNICEYPINSNKIVNESKSKLYTYFTPTNPTGTYIYDFRDNWEHIIELEKIIDVDSPVERCVNGAELCPVEDSGGVNGYKDILEILKDPYHPEYVETMNWLKRPQKRYDIVAGIRYHAPDAQYDI